MCKKKLEPTYEDVVGIGPVVSGEYESEPCYYIDLVYPNGNTKRIHVKKRPDSGGKESERQLDRKARMEALGKRNVLVNQLRPGVVVLHDKASLRQMVTLLSTKP